MMIHFFNSLDLFQRYADAGVPFEQMFVSSDFGQKISPDPVAGLYKFFKIYYRKKLGFTEEMLTSLAKTVPAKIMGIE